MSEPKPTEQYDGGIAEMLGDQLEKSTATIDELVARVRKDKAEAEAAQRVIDTQAAELDKLITLHLRCIGENNRMRSEIAEMREGKPGDQPPVVGDGLRSSGMKVVLTERHGYRLANYWPEYQVWFESWTMFQLNDAVVTWWELGGTK